MNDVMIPADRLIRPRFRGAPLSQDGMHRVFETVLRRHLYAGPIPLEEFLLMDEPGETPAKGSRRPGRVASTPTEFDLSPRYEMRYTEDLAVSELGVVGYCDEDVFTQNVEFMWNEAWSQLGGANGEQAGGQWQMVACAIRQQDLATLVPVRGAAPDEISTIRNSDGERPPSIRLDGPGTGGVAGYAQGVSTRWVVPMVFVDVSRSELRDPAKLYGNRPGAWSALTEYILTRQMRHMAPTLRANRKQGCDLIEEFIARARTFSDGQKTREVARLAPEQLQAIREAVAHGMPEALLAQSLGVELDTLRRILDGAVPEAK